MLFGLHPSLSLMDYMPKNWLDCENRVCQIIGICCEDSPISSFSMKRITMTRCSKKAAANQRQLPQQDS